MKSFKEESIEAMQKIIQQWKSQNQYSWENKQLYLTRHPVVQDELILHFSNKVDYISKSGLMVNTFLLSPYFATNTLSQSPGSENSNGDAYRLKTFLEKFDKEFYESVQAKLDDESNFDEPLFWE